MLRPLESLIIKLAFITVLTAYCMTDRSYADSASETANKPKIAIIIDDLGHKKQAGEAVINLDIPLAVAVLPHTPHAIHLAEYARKNDVEVMLHLPMQPSFDARLMTPDTLSINMDEDQFKQVVAASLQALPHVAGVNNHMGSLFTQLPEQMAWLMETLQENQSPLFFVDSFTSERSIAHEVAETHAIPNTKRDVFLDRQLDREHMQAQFSKLKRIAEDHGQVVVIGHPFKETISLLKQHIPELKKQGFEFVKVSSLTKTQSRSVQQASDNEQIDSKLKTLH